MSCIGCTKRHVGCHDKCEDYQKEKKQRDIEREKIHKAKLLDNVMTGKEVQRIVDAKKRKGLRK